MLFDGSGKVSGTYVLEYGSGGPSPVQTITGAFTGTYSSNPDGSGSMTMALDNGVGLTLSMVTEDSGRGLQFVATSCAGGFDLSTTVVGGIGLHAKRSTPGGVAALKGFYGGQFTFSPQPSRSTFVAAFDGAGNVTTSETFVGAGPNVSSAVYPGTYTLNSKGIGAITLAAQPGQGPQNVSDRGHR
ncbi:MAG: hypothetical protein U0Q18_19680 [Bryobacteraceae bacterium]